MITLSSMRSIHEVQSLSASNRHQRRRIVKQTLYRRVRLAYGQSLIEYLRSNLVQFNGQYSMIGKGLIGGSQSPEVPGIDV